MNRTYVKEILETPLGRLWTTQEFGKMATDVTSNARLHIWDRRLLRPEVPAIHSHAFDFKSIVLVGRMRNLRFFESNTEDAFNRILVPGSGEVTRAWLQELPMEVYGEQVQYKQKAEEIHQSMPDDGTITLVEWLYDESPRPMTVYWRGRLPWNDAKPRQATDEEIVSVAKRALDLWF